MGKYTNVGKQVLFHGDEGNVTHIADASDAEKAQAIAFRMNGGLDFDRQASSADFDYVGQAMATMSPSFHGGRVAKSNFVGAINDFIKAATRLDMMKKSLFYGRDNNLISEGQRDCAEVPAVICDGNLVAGRKVMSHDDAVVFVHGVIGIATEAGELVEVLRDALNGHGVDMVNVKEEIGDSKWYMAILSRIAGFVWGDDERQNIYKLRVRFPDRFTEYDANNRNLPAERGALETHLPIGQRSNRMEGERRHDGDAIEAATSAASNASGERV